MARSPDTSIARWRHRPIASTARSPDVPIARSPDVQVRVFRVFKFGRYSVGIQMFVGAIVKSRQPLMVLVFMVGISTTIISSVMYLVEDDPCAEP